MIRGTTQIAAKAATLYALMQHLHSAFAEKLPGRTSKCASVRLFHRPPLSIPVLHTVLCHFGPDQRSLFDSTSRIIPHKSQKFNPENKFFGQYSEKEKNGSNAKKTVVFLYTMWYNVGAVLGHVPERGVDTAGIFRWGPGMIECMSIGIGDADTK